MGPGPVLGHWQKLELVTANGYAYKTLRQLSEMQMLCLARIRGEMAMAKHVMNCLFGHSINLQLYEVAQLQCSSAWFQFQFQFLFQFRPRNGCSSQLPAPRFGCKVPGSSAGPCSVVKYATFYGTKAGVGGLGSGGVIKNHKKWNTNRNKHAIAESIKAAAALHLCICICSCSNCSCICICASAIKICQKESEPKRKRK